MPNQYNAADLTNVPQTQVGVQLGDGYPLQSASGVGGGNAVPLAEANLFPSTPNEIVKDFGIDAPATPATMQTSVEPGNLGGASDTSVAGAFDGGSSTTQKVVDFEDANFPTPAGEFSGHPNTDPFLGRDEDGVSTPV